jgi:hypothetical protein
MEIRSLGVVGLLERSELFVSCSALLSSVPVAGPDNVRAVWDEGVSSDFFEP